MFSFATRVNYKVNAEEEARQIKESKNAYKVRYLGTRTFVIFENAFDEKMFDKIDREEKGFTPECRCWA